MGTGGKVCLARKPGGRVKTDPLIILWIIIGYLSLLLVLGLVSARFFRGTSKDYFVASHSIGPFLLLMSVFGTTMTAFALVGSTGKSFERGIGVYGLMASISSLVHAAVFFLIGIRLWSFGKRLGFVTQIQFFRARFDSNGLGYLLFPILVGLVIPYLLIGIIGAGKTIQSVTTGAFPGHFSHPLFDGGVPPWITGLVVCFVVLVYVFAGGSRSTAWANTFQTLIFMVMGLVAFFFIVNSLGGFTQANRIAAEITSQGQIVQRFSYDKTKKRVVKLENPKVIGNVGHLDKDGKVVIDKEAAQQLAGIQPHLSRTVIPTTYKAKNRKPGKLIDRERELGIPYWMFLTYLFIPLSVGMFPHLFQHWLTAKSAKAFRLTVIAHPIFIMIVWVPCVLIGAWASGLLPPGIPPAAVLAKMLKMLVGNPVLIGLLIAGILAAIMSSLDSQFLCLGTIFTNDIVLHRSKPGRFSDKQIIWIARGFVIGIVTLTYVLALIAMEYGANVFDLAIWCFSGFSGLFPLVFAAVYWKRASRTGAICSVIVTMIVWFILFREAGYGGEYLLPGGIIPAAVIFAASLVTLFVVSLATKPPTEETIKKFFPA